MAVTFQHGPLGIKTDDRYRTLPEARIVEMLTLMGWAYERESSLAVQASKEALQSWTQIGLGFRCAENGERLFDLVEVTNFLKWAGLEGRDGFFAERYVRNSRRLVSDMAEKDSSDLTHDGGRPFVVDFERVFNLRSVTPGSRLRLRAPLPLEGNYLRNLEVTPFTELVQNAQVDVRPGRIESRFVVSGEAEMTLGARLTFSAWPEEPGHSDVVEEPDKELYLRPKEGLIVVTDRISALAHALAGTGASTLEAVRAFWDYINREMFCGVLHYDQIDLAAPCDWSLDSGWMDCQTGAALFAALCRAQGIPARILGGNMLYQRSPTTHYWAEVWIENQGWTPFDFIGWDLSCGGRDLEWRDRFFGRLDCRLTTQCMPKAFTGAIGVPIPPAWSILMVPSGGGMEMSFLDINGTPVYADTVCVGE